MGSEKLAFTITQTWDGHPIGTDEQVTLSLSPTADGLRIEVDAPFHADPPPLDPPGPTDHLWEFEVVELFLAGQITSGGLVPYTEVELSPHGHHLVLRLEGIRRPVERLLPLSYEATIAGERWSGIALLPWAYLPEGLLSVNAYALHGTGENRRYLAMVPVPGTVPDFHQPAVFRPLLLDCTGNTIKTAGVTAGRSPNPSSQKRATRGRA